jgi:hypothetical protein
MCARSRGPIFSRSDDSRRNRPFRSRRLPDLRIRNPGQGRYAAGMAHVPVSAARWNGADHHVDRLPAEGAERAQGRAGGPVVLRPDRQRARRSLADLHRRQRAVLRADHQSRRARRACWCIGTTTSSPRRASRWSRERSRGRERKRTGSSSRAGWSTRRATRWGRSGIAGRPRRDTSVLAHCRVLPSPGNSTVRLPGGRWKESRADGSAPRLIRRSDARGPQRGE